MAMCYFKFQELLEQVKNVQQSSLTVTMIAKC